MLPHVCLLQLVDDMSWHHLWIDGWMSFLTKVFFFYVCLDADAVLGRNRHDKLVVDLVKVREKPPLTLVRD